MIVSRCVLRPYSIRFPYSVNEHTIFIELNRVHWFSVFGRLEHLCTMLSDEGSNARRRVLTKTLSQDDIPRIPPASEKLFENLPWLGIMADIAITAAVAEIKVE